MNMLLFAFFLLAFSSQNDVDASCSHDSRNSCRSNRSCYWLDNECKEVLKDIWYAREGQQAGGKDRILHIYGATDESKPVLMINHGRGGDSDKLRSTALRFVEQGYLVFAPTLGTFSATKQAFTWIKNNAKNYGGDMNRFSCHGYSAGGFRCTDLAISQTKNGDSEWFKAVVVNAGAPRSICGKAHEHVPPFLFVHNENDPTVSIDNVYFCLQRFERAGALNEPETAIFETGGHTMSGVAQKAAGEEFLRRHVFPEPESEVTTESVVSETLPEDAITGDDVSADSVDGASENNADTADETIDTNASEENTNVSENGDPSAQTPVWDLLVSTTDGDNGCAHSGQIAARGGQSLEQCEEFCQDQGAVFLQSHENDWCSCFSECALTRPASDYNSAAHIYELKESTPENEEITQNEFFLVDYNAHTEGHMMRVYPGTGSQELKPAILVLSRKNEFDDMCGILAVEGFFVMCPAWSRYNDVRRVISWTRNNLGAFHGDQDRFGLLSIEDATEHAIREVYRLSPDIFEALVFQKGVKNSSIDRVQHSIGSTLIIGSQQSRYFDFKQALEDQNNDVEMLVENDFNAEEMQNEIKSFFQRKL